VVVARRVMGTEVWGQGDGSGVPFRDKGTVLVYRLGTGGRFYCPSFYRSILVFFAKKSNNCKKQMYFL